MATCKYDTEIDLSVDNAHTRVIRLVGERKRILEVGCATGYMAKVLAEQFGCSITGVELDGEAASSARRFCQSVIVGDVESLDFERTLDGDSFDVVICADVLEHLRNPAATLARLRKLLAPSGYLIASIPNIAHVSVITDLIRGHFDYRPLGLLDSTHLRFFTRETLYACFEAAGMAITHLERLTLEPEATEFRTELVRFSPEVVELLRSGEESTTYQFVVVARPQVEDAAHDSAGADSGGSHSPPPVRPVHARLAAVYGHDSGRADAGVVEALIGRLAFLEDQRARLGLELERARTALDATRNQVSAQTGHVRNLEGEMARRDAELETLRSELAAHASRIGHLEAELARRDADLNARATEATSRAAQVRHLEAEVERGEGELQHLRGTLAWTEGRVRQLETALSVFGPIIAGARVGYRKLVPRGSRRERLVLRLRGS
jgi:2-polyprenyl-3-methyl-5-hydroxy-6-metoxy-1,4-benzoquinol methylase